MNRKNLTAAVLAGLAGAAGIAGTAQAVNMNPDGLGQVLIYPYYTANDGNTTILSVVNTTHNAKAVKVRFMEGFNSREVLDFNLYLSPQDVWVAAIATSEVSTPVADYETNTYLIIPDDSCTVPYLYADAATEMPDGSMAGIQPFLNLAYTGDFADGGPTSDARAAEGHFEMIEMGTIKKVDCKDDDDPVLGPVGETFCDITHRNHYEYDDDDDKIDGTGEWYPGNCEQLVENWTGSTDPSKNGVWFNEALENALGDDCDTDDLLDLDECGQAFTDTDRNSGGMFGGAAIVHPSNGAMWSYDAQAIQGFDKSDIGIHYIPGTIHPSLNDGDQTNAYVFFGVPQNKSVELDYAFSVDAVSAVFMHEFVMNQYSTPDIPAEAATEWVITFPTKNFYADPLRIAGSTDSNWVPSTDDGDGIFSCLYWEEGDEYPKTKSPISDDPIDGPGPWPNPGWEDCVYEQDFFVADADAAVSPFTELFGADDCELAALVTYDRDERTFTEERGGSFPPVVSPSPPSPCDPAIQFCEDVIFELCNEVNVLRFGERSVFNSTVFEDDESLVVTVINEFGEGWGWIDFGLRDKDGDLIHVDSQGLVGLPVTGFAAQQFENDYVEGDDGTVKAFYGGLYRHASSVRKVD